MKKYLNFLKVVIICLFLASVHENAFSANKKKMFYSSRSVFVRIEPDKDANIVAEVKQGEKLEEIGHYDLPNWIKVKLSNGKIGWITKGAISNVRKEKIKEKEKYFEEINIKKTDKRLVENRIDQYEYNRAIKEINYLIEFIESGVRHEWVGGGYGPTCDIEKIYKEYPIPTYLTEKLISAWSKALKHHDWTAREEAAKGLGILKAKSAVPVLKEALRDSEQWVQVKAAGALVKIGDKDGIKFLIEKLEKEFDKKEAETFGRQYAIEVLGDSGDKLAIPVLQRYLSYPTGGVLPILAKEALGKIDKLALIEGEKAAKENKLKKLKQERIKAWRDLQSKRQIRTWEEYVELVHISVYLNIKLPKRGKGLDYGEEIRMDSGVIYNIMEAPDSYVGRYFWSTVPRGLFGPMVEQMASVSSYKIKGNGCSFFLNFSPVWVAGSSPDDFDYQRVTGRGYFTARLVVPRRRYQEVLCRFIGLEEFVNVYGEKGKLPKFQIVAVCGWNSYSADGRINKVFTCDTHELDQIIRKFKN